MADEEQIDWSYDALVGEYGKTMANDLRDAALMVQKSYRSRRALRILRDKVRERYVIETDVESGHRFYTNQVTGEVQWDKPALLGNEPYLQMTEDQAARKLQGMWRTRACRMMVKQMIRSFFTTGFDDSSGYYFYKDKRTNETFWEKPMALGTEDLEPGYTIPTKGELVWEEQKKREGAPTVSGPRAGDASNIIFGGEYVQLVRFNVCEAIDPQRFRISTAEGDEEWRRVLSFFAYPYQYGHTIRYWVEWGSNPERYRLNNSYAQVG
jgi:hypothetical protein